jgi:hypothetical protein
MAMPAEDAALALGDARCEDRGAPVLSDQLARVRGTPRSTVEAIVWAVRERSVAALKEPANIERLSRCDAGARTEINQRIASLMAAKKVAP